MATIWGGPTYVEFAVRCWRLIKKEDFFRPLGTSSRWAFDITHWIFVLTIAAVTALLIIGSAPHIVWLRILSLPGPALLYCLGGSIFILTMWSLSGRRAPFRISSTPKGGEVYPGVYYLIEDVVAVNANAGRPYREALAARYKASPRFRRMIKQQSLFWSIPSLIVAVACTVVIVIHPVPKEVAYGIGELKPKSDTLCPVPAVLTQESRMGSPVPLGMHMDCHLRPMGPTSDAYGNSDMGRRLRRRAGGEKGSQEAGTYHLGRRHSAQRARTLKLTLFLPLASDRRWSSTMRPCTITSMPLPCAYHLTQSVIDGRA